MDGCLPFRVFLGKNILHQGNHRWGGFPSSSTTIISRMWQCMTWIQRSVRLEARPVQSTVGVETTGFYEAVHSIETMDADSESPALLSEDIP